MAGSAPDDPDDPVLEPTVDAPLLDADRHRRGVDGRRLVVAARAGTPFWCVRAGELPHLRGGGFARQRPSESRFDPLDPGAAVPAGAPPAAPARRDRASAPGRSSRRRGRDAAAARTSSGKTQLAPGASTDAIADVSSSTPETRTASGARRSGHLVEQTFERHAVPLDGAHQSEVLRVAVAGALDDVRTHRPGVGGQRCGRQPRRRLGRPARPNPIVQAARRATARAGPPCARTAWSAGVTIASSASTERSR